MFYRGGDHSFANTFRVHDLSLPYSSQQFSDSVVSIEATKAHEDVPTVRLQSFFLVSVFRSRELRPTVFPSSSLRSSSNRSPLMKRSCTCLHDVKGYLGVIFLHFFLFCCCCCLSPSFGCFSLFLCCCGGSRDCSGSCRSRVACLPCAFVAKCSLARHRVCSKKFRVLLQLWCLVYDFSQSYDHRVSNCPFGDCSQSFVLFVDVHPSIFSNICSRIASRL